MQNSDILRNNLQRLIYSERSILKKMQNISDWIQQYLGLSSEVQNRILTSLLAVLVLIILQRIVLLFVYRQNEGCRHSLSLA